MMTNSFRMNVTFGFRQKRFLISRSAEVVSSITNPFLIGLDEAEGESLVYY